MSDLQPNDDVSELDRIGEARAAALRDKGFETVSDIAGVHAKELMSFGLVGGNTAASIYQQSRKAMLDYGASADQLARLMGNVDPTLRGQVRYKADKNGMDELATFARLCDSDQWKELLDKVESERL